MVTAEEVQDSITSASTPESQSDSSPRETNQRVPAASSGPEPDARTVMKVEPEPEPEVQRSPEPEGERELLPQSVPLFSQPLQRPVAEHQLAATTLSDSRGISQQQAAGLPFEQPAAETAAAAQQKAVDKAAAERALHEQKEARRRADEYAARVLPARAKYEAALQQLRQSEAATQERWAVRRQQDTNRLATQRRAVLAAAEARRKQAQENERAVLALVDRMRPKVVAYKEQYAGWYKRTYGSSTGRQPTQMRCVLAWRRERFVPYQQCYCMQGLSVR